MRHALPTRRLGRSSLSVTRLGFGSVPIGNYPDRIGTPDAVAAVEAAYRAGIRLFDTAPLYGRGLAERRLGLALHDLPQDGVVLSTKVGRLLRPCRERVFGPDAGARIFVDPPPFDTRFDYTYDGVMRSIEDSLQRLGTSHVDLVSVHNIDPGNHAPDTVEALFRSCMEGGYRALHDLRAQGVIRAIGVGNNWWQMLLRFARHGDFDCFMLAGHYTLLDQTALAELLPECERRGISILLAAPFESGVLATGSVGGARFNYGKADEVVLSRVRRIEEICGRHGVSIAAAALQFPLAHPAVAAVVPGSASVRQVEANAAAFAAVIPEGFWSEIANAALLDPRAPLPGRVISNTKPLREAKP